MKTGERKTKRGTSMIKIILQTLVGIGIATLVLGTPPAYAVFGIRAARTVMAARKAKKLASSSAADKTAAQEGETSAGQPAHGDQKPGTLAGNQ